MPINKNSGLKLDRFNELIGEGGGAGRKPARFCYEIRLFTLSQISSAEAGLGR